MNSMSLGENLKALAWRAMALLIVCGFAFGVSVWADPVRTNYSQAELVAEQASIPADGGIVTLGLAYRAGPDVARLLDQSRRRWPCGDHALESAGGILCI